MSVGHPANVAGSRIQEGAVATPIIYSHAEDGHQEAHRGESQATQNQCGTLCIIQHMKESVEKHKDEVRNMTMILNSPDMLMNLSIAQNEPQSPGLGHGGVGVGADNQNNQLNILDELN